MQHVSTPAYVDHMSTLWQGKFFLQTGLPASLPRPPTVLRDPGYPQISEGERRRKEQHKLYKRGGSCRGKDKGKRRVRNPILFNFFECIKRIEAKECDSGTDPAQLHVEFKALTQSERAYWEFMHDLYKVYKEQQRTLRVIEVNATPYGKMQKLFALEFYHLAEEKQAQLVRDALAVRWRDENITFAQQSCEQDDRNLITDIRKDVANILVRIDEAMKYNNRRGPGARHNNRRDEGHENGPDNQDNNSQDEEDNNSAPDSANI
jgi:hypothetical protein